MDTAILSKSATEIDLIVKSSGWTQTTFCADDLIDAFEEGKRAGWEDVQKAFSKKISDSLSRAFSEAEDLFDRIRDLNLSPERVYLRICSVVPFRSEALYLIPEERYVSDDMLTAFELAGRREDELCDEGIGLGFRFMPYNAHTSHHAIMCDGFAFFYDQEQRPE